MKQALREEQPSWPRNERKDAPYRGTPSLTPCRRHVAPLQSTCNISLRKIEDGFTVRDCEDRSGVFHPNISPQEKKAETTRKDTDEHYTCRGLEDEITRGRSRGKFNSCTVKLQSLDFHSPRELTSSSFDKFTTASGSRLPRGAGDEARTNVSAVFYKGTEKNIIQDDHGNYVDPTGGRSGEAPYRAVETERKNVSTKAFPCTTPRNKTSCHSTSVALRTAKSSFLKTSLLTDEPLLVRRNVRHPSITKGILPTGGDQPPVSASEDLRKYKPRNAYTSQTPPREQTPGVISSEECVLFATGAQSTRVAARTEDDAVNREQGARPAQKPARWEAAPTIGRIRKAPHRQSTLEGSETFKGSAETSQCPPSSIDEKTRSDVSADGLSWIDYPVRECWPRTSKTTCSQKNSAHCRSVEERALSKKKTQFLKQAEQPESHVGERFGFKRADRDGPYDKMNCFSPRGRTRRENGGSTGEPHYAAHDNIDAPVARLCESEYTTSVGKDKSSPYVELFGDTEQAHHRRDSWTNASHWKAQLNFSRSHSGRDARDCEYELSMRTTRCRALQKNLSKKVSQTLRRKMGDAVNRLRRSRALASVKQARPETWCLHVSRVSSSTSPNHVERDCPKKTRSICTVDTHRNHQTHASEDVLSDSQNLGEYKTPWAETGSADAEATIQKENSLCEKCDFLTLRPPSVACSTIGADRVQPVAALQRSCLSSAVVEEPPKTDNNARSRRIQPLSLSSASEVDESDTGDCSSSSQSNCSVEDVWRPMRVDRISAGTTLSTSSVGSEKRFEGYRQPKGVQSQLQKTPPYTLETQHEGHFVEGRTGELRKSSYDPVTGVVEAGIYLSRRLSDVVTQASSDHPHNCADSGNDGSTYTPNEVTHVRYDPSQVDELLTFDHNRQPSLASTSPAQNPESSNIDRRGGGYQCASTQKVHKATTAITFSDIEASIEWIIEASSNPKLLRAAKELLLRKEDAERNTAPLCYQCRARNLPMQWADLDFCIYPSTERTSNVNTISSQLPSQAMSLDQSVYSSTRSSQSSFDYQHFQGRRIKATKKDSHFDADARLPSISSYKTGTVQIDKSGRRIHGEEMRTRICDPEFDHQFTRLSRQKVNGHRRRPQKCEQDYLKTASLCYAPSDVEWNMDQLI